MHKTVSVLALALGTLVATAPTAHAATNPAPRIVSARMLDTDRDDRADRVLLTWSEPVRHRADRDGRYPVSVAGYRVLYVPAVRGSRYLTVPLAEHTTPDIAARPAVRYTKTRRGAVADLKRKKAGTQTTYSTLPLDLDRDGYARTDCRPTVGWVHPGATDVPDTALVDANCDGIDGARTGPVFVSVAGNDANDGSITAPVLTFATAVTKAAGTRDIYVGTGTWTSAVSAPVTGRVFGGYGANWSRSRANATVLDLDEPLTLGPGTSLLQLLEVRAPAATTGEDSTALVLPTGADATLDSVKVLAKPGAAATTLAPATDSIAVKATGATLHVVGGSLSAARGGAGLAGAGGLGGTPGAPGTDGTDGLCSVGTGALLGGPGGIALGPGQSGGSGGAGGTIVLDPTDGSSATGGQGGAHGANGTTTGTPGGAGAPGAVGGDGAAGGATDGLWTDTSYTPATSLAGSPGTAGHGGSGGGGGGSTATPPGLGSGGGGGGAGGSAGTGGLGGTGGGASVAVWAVGSTVSLARTTVATVGGGAGGQGGPGGAGASGGDGGAGGTSCGGVGAGGQGGAGGSGGDGGAGGAGTGGPSVGVLRTGGSTLTQSGVTWAVGPGGTSASTAGQSLPLGTLVCGLLTQVLPGTAAGC